MDKDNLLKLAIELYGKDAQIEIKANGRCADCRRKERAHEVIWNNLH